MALTKDEEDWVKRQYQISILSDTIRGMYDAMEAGLNSMESGHDEYERTKREEIEHIEKQMMDLKNAPTPMNDL